MNRLNKVKDFLIDESKCIRGCETAQDAVIILSLIRLVSWKNIKHQCYLFSISIIVVHFVFNLETEEEAEFLCKMCISTHFMEV